MTAKNMGDIVRRGRERAEDRETLSGMDVPKESLGFIMDERSSYTRRKVINAIKAGEISTGIDDIRKKMKEI